MTRVGAVGGVTIAQLGDVRRRMADAQVFADEIFGFHAQQAAEKSLIGERSTWSNVSITGRRGNREFGHSIDL